MRREKVTQSVTQKNQEAAAAIVGALKLKANITALPTEICGPVFSGRNFC
jgi:hypothetical protein